MPTAAQGIQMEIRAREEERTRLRDEQAQLETRITEIDARRFELNTQIEALLAALAVIQEQVVAPARQESVPEPVSAPESPDPDPAPTPAIEAADEATAPPTRTGRRSLTDNPLAVKHVNPSTNDQTGRGRGSKKPKRYLDPVTASERPDLRWDQLSDTERERTEAVMMLLDDHTEMSQFDLAKALCEVMEGDVELGTAQSIVSQCIAILQVNNLVIYTGCLGATDSGRKSSPIWKLAYKASPAELAAAGLTISDDNYAGTTTRWPVRSEMQQFIRIESSAYEQGKGR